MLTETGCQLSERHAICAQRDKLSVLRETDCQCSERQAVCFQLNLRFLWNTMTKKNGFPGSNRNSMAPGSLKLMEWVVRTMAVCSAAAVETLASSRLAQIRSDK